MALVACLTIGRYGHSMNTPGPDPSEQLVAALTDGLAHLYVLVRALEAGALDLGVDPPRWARVMTLLEWAMNELRTNELVTSGYRLTEEDLARVRSIREHGHRALAGGEVSPELYGLAVQALETMCGPDWKENMGRQAQGLLV
jgi:hypothetical protein